MADDLLVLHASELLTLRGPERARTRVEMSDLSMIRDGAVAVSDGIVKDVGKSESILKEHDATGVERIDAKDRVVMPGFTDPHTHLVYAAARRSREAGVEGRFLFRAGRAMPLMMFSRSGGDYTTARRGDARSKRSVRYLTGPAGRSLRTACESVQ